jgi:hypothetical protein
MRRDKVAGCIMWLVILATFGLSAQTWIDLARIATFTQSATIKGFEIQLAWLMPVAVDGYVIVALMLWLADVDEKLARFAKWNTYSGAGFGVLAQSAFHAFKVSQDPKSQAWQIAIALSVGAVPPLFSAISIHMRVSIVRYAATKAKEAEALRVSRMSASRVAHRTAPAAPVVPIVPATPAVSVVPAAPIVPATPATPIVPAMPATSIVPVVDHIDPEAPTHQEAVVIGRGALAQQAAIADAAAIAEHGETLRELASRGELTPARISRICDVKPRAARRIMAAITAE